MLLRGSAVSPGLKINASLTFLPLYAIASPVLAAMQSSGSLEWTRQQAIQEADKAIATLSLLPDTPWRQALTGLAHMAVRRDH